MIAKVWSAVAMTAALTLTGCSQNITGTAVTAAGSAPEAASGGDESQCTTVDAPLADIPTEDDREPLLRIPMPAGWERNTMMDSQVIRYALVAMNLMADGFATNAVVTLESAPGSQTPDDVFDQNRGNLETMMGAYDLEVEANTTCGLPSETTHYMAPPMGPAPERPIVMHAVVARSAGTTYLATLTIQTTEPDDPTYLSDSQEIIDGFQMLPPSS
jgi:Probable lipoprotein LpqN